MKKCLICERIDLIKKGKNPYFVKELKSGYVVLGDHQFYKGYTLLLSKTHTNELHKLSKPEKIQFLKDMANTAEAVYMAFKPRKLNYELLGNTDSHLHWHIFPRYQNDPKPDQTIWKIPYSVRSNKKTIADPIELQKLKEKLMTNF